MVEPLRRVGRYELLEVLGRGGAAVVYLAHQPDLDRRVALKELAAHHAADPSFAQRFVEESHLAAAMNHPSIVTVFEYFEHDGLPYIAMEYMSQGSLRGHLAKLSGAQLGGVLQSVLQGLAYAEKLGIVHRDLKPENLLVGVNGEVKIADFGVARALLSTTIRPFATVEGTPIGTPAYMAPEQAMGKPVTAAADLYSVGIIAWEALAGRTPFGSAETPMAILYQQVHEEVPPIESIRDDVHPGACRWLARMLAKRPEDRFQSAEQAWDELEGVLIDMLGARWRRGAALVGLEQQTSNLQTPTAADPFAGADRPQPSAGTLADSPFGGDGADDEEDLRIRDRRKRPQTSAVLTPDPTAGLGPELDPFVPLTPLPDSEPVADDLHSFRAAAATATRRGGSGSRSPALVATAGVLVVLAAAAGGAIGASASPRRAPARAPVTTTTASQSLALAVRPILYSVSTGTAAARRSFDTAARKSEKDQVAPAALVARRYAGGLKQLKALPSADQRQPELAEVERLIAGLSTDWRTVSYDATHNKREQFLATVKRIKVAQSELVDDALKVEQG